MNSRVEPEVIYGPLSETASSTGANVNGGIEGEGAGGRLVLAGLDQLEQPLALECVEERDLHLGRGLLGRDQLADPFAGHEVHDREHGVLGAAVKVGDVVDPDRVAAVLCPLGKRPALGPHDPAGSLENQVVCSENPTDGGRETHTSPR